ncbi:DUF1622 domain-containing protein [Methanolobus chelungpuianus]|uniref:DUF1622 domain-containing protein n=1 Tax=Methanolobus chelungpuianus TaxID=502115 RepID=UPI00211497D8|nr:DUF1622 domain-containing protein [Methanolobus chelungpuianus]
MSVYSVTLFEWGFLALGLFQLFLTMVGLAMIIYGGIVATIEIIFHETRKKNYTYAHIRHQFTDKILFGLEFLIAADVIRTIQDPTPEEILTLGAIVLIRTVMGYFLSKEVQEYSFLE